MKKNVYKKYLLGLRRERVRQRAIPQEIKEGKAMPSEDKDKRSYIYDTSRVLEKFTDYIKQNHPHRLNSIIRFPQIYAWIGRAYKKEKSEARDIVLEWIEEGLVERVQTRGIRFSGSELDMSIESDVTKFHKKGRHVDES